MCGSLGEMTQCKICVGGVISPAHILHWVTGRNTGWGGSGVLGVALVAFGVLMHVRLLQAHAHLRGSPPGECQNVSMSASDVSMSAGCVGVRAERVEISVERVENDAAPATYMSAGCQHVSIGCHRLCRTRDKGVGRERKGGGLPFCYRWGGFAL